MSVKAATRNNYKMSNSPGLSRSFAGSVGGARTAAFQSRQCLIMVVGDIAISLALTWYHLYVLVEHAESPSGRITAMIVLLSLISSRSFSLGPMLPGVHDAFESTEANVQW